MIKNDPTTSSSVSALASANHDTSASTQRGRLLRAKAAYTTRRIARDALAGVRSDREPPRAGDVLLARVTRLGRHEHLELTTGRRSSLFTGDEILVCFGNRYAPDQFEAVVPSQLGACHLVAAGGIAAQALSWHNTISGPTSIEPIGFAVDARDQRVNVKDWALPVAAPAATRPYTLAVLGTSMNAGKTTTAAHLIKGAARAGMRVAAAKLTGTGAGGDAWLMTDAGAQPVYDFTDVGHASTYLTSSTELERVMRDLLSHLSASGAEVVVLEVADGLFQQETAALVNSAAFADAVDGVLFAAADAMGAAGGARLLRERGLNVIGITGSVTRSPLASREAKAASGMPLYKLDQLSSPAFICDLIGTTEREAPAAQAG